MNSTTENYKKKWRSLRKEFEAKATYLGAVERIKYQNALVYLTDEMYAAGDWTKAAWEEYVAKVDKKWHELSVKLPD